MPQRYYLTQLFSQFRYSQKSSSRPPMPELIPTSAACISSSQSSFSKSSFVDALPPFCPPSFHSHRSPPPPGLCLPMPTMAPQSGMGSLHQPMVMTPMPGWGQFEMLTAQLAASESFWIFNPGLQNKNDKFLFYVKHLIYVTCSWNWIINLYIKCHLINCWHQLVLFILLLSTFQLWRVNSRQSRVDQHINHFAFVDCWTIYLCPFCICSRPICRTHLNQDL